MRDFTSASRKRVGPWNPLGWPQPEVGWTISPHHLRRGYAAEAGRASIDYAFSVLGWKEVVHVILEGNVGSIAVAEKLALMQSHFMSPADMADLFEQAGAQLITLASDRINVHVVLTK